MILVRGALYNVWGYEYQTNYSFSLSELPQILAQQSSERIAMERMVLGAE
jgi:hypothetical protein